MPVQTRRLITQLVLVIRAFGVAAVALTDAVSALAINTTAVQHVLPAHFLSYTHDAYFLVADLGVQPTWSSPRLQRMLRALAPALIRVGGGDMDYTEMHFPAATRTRRAEATPAAGGQRPAPAVGAHLCPPAPSGYVQPCGEQCRKNCVMNATTWGPFLAFAETVGVKVIAGLNALQGRMGGSMNSSRPWDPSPARDFVRWSTAAHPSTIVAWELG